MTDRQQTALERVITTVAATVIAAAMLWAATTLAEVTNRISVIQEQIAMLQDKVDGNYTQADADEDFKPVMRALDDHEQRLRNLERNR